MADYRRVGDRGHRPDTEIGRNSALLQLMTYCSSRAIPHPRNENWNKIQGELDLCNEEFWQRFGGFLIDHAKTRFGTGFVGSSAGQYLSHCKEYVRELFPNHRIWINHETAKGMTPSRDACACVL